MLDAILESLRDVLCEGYASAGPCHDLSHVVRVARIAERLCALEGVDAYLPIMASLFHDIGRSEIQIGEHDDHEMRSARIASRVLLAQGVSPADLDIVVSAITSHRFSKTSYTSPSAVAELFQDADRLDAIGYTGVSRAYLWLGEHRWRLPDDVSAAGRQNYDALLSHWQEKLSKIPDRMHTASGREMARQRASAMEEFLRELRAEIDMVPGPLGPRTARAFS